MNKNVKCILTVALILVVIAGSVGAWKVVATQTVNIQRDGYSVSVSGLNIGQNYTVSPEGNIYIPDGDAMIIAWMQVSNNTPYDNEKVNISYNVARTRSLQAVGHAKCDDAMASSEMQSYGPFGEPTSITIKCSFDTTDAILELKTQINPISAWAAQSTSYAATPTVHKP